MRAFTAPVISAVSLQLSHVSHSSLFSVLNNEVELWLPTLASHVILFLSLTAFMGFSEPHYLASSWYLIPMNDDSFPLLSRLSPRSLITFHSFVPITSTPFIASCHHYFSSSSLVFSSLPLFFPLCWQWIVHTVYIDSGNIVNCFWSVLLCAQSQHSMS